MRSWRIFLGRVSWGAGGRIYAARGYVGEPANLLIFQLRRASYTEGLFGLHGVSAAEGTQLTMISSKWRVPNPERAAQFRKTPARRAKALEQVPRSEGVGQQRVERGVEACGRIAYGDHPGVGAEFVDDLATCATGGRRRFCWGVNHDGSEFSCSRRRGGKNRGSLGAVAQAVGSVLHIAASENFPGSHEDGCSHGELGIRTIRIARCAAGGFFQTAEGGGGDHCWVMR